MWDNDRDFDHAVLRMRFACKHTPPILKSKQKKARRIMRLLKHTDINYRYIPTSSNIAKLPDQGLPEKMKLNKPKARDLVSGNLDHRCEDQAGENIELIRTFGEHSLSCQQLSFSSEIFDSDK